MSGTSATTERRPRPAGSATALVLTALLPLLGLVLLLSRPSVDARVENHPAHFWLVFGAAALNAVLAYATATAASRRADARVLLVSLAFLCAAGFLGLHALATPGILLPKPNAGFQLATPVGLFLASVFSAASAADLSGERGRRVVAAASVLQVSVLVAMAAWAALSLLAIPPLHADATVPQRGSGAFAALGFPALVFYAYAAISYLRTYRHRRQPLLLQISLAFILLAEAMIAVALAPNWHLSWWEWHVLMLLAFALIAWSAQRQWYQERFSPLYLAETAAGQREVSVLFADLAGFTSFSEAHDPGDVRRMLNEYFEGVIPPIVRHHGGDIDNIIGDALMVTFNRRGDQPDHAVRAARAALEMQSAMSAVTSRHPDWPRFRIGVNSGEAVVGMLGTAGGRTHTVLGDVVNVAARLESAAPVGGIAIGAGTAGRLAGATTEPLGSLHVKGRDEPVEAHRLIQLPD